MPRAARAIRIFENSLLAIQYKGLRIMEAKAGVVFDVGNVGTAIFMGPLGASYDDLNNYSAVSRVTYGDTSFLFARHAEVLSQREMMAGDLSLPAVAVT